MAAVLDRNADLKRILEETRTVAVLGASHDPSRAGHYVAEYLHRVGYRVIPVNPHHAGAVWHGEPVRGSLADIDEPIDLIDVFRRSDAVPGHVDEILALRPLPATVWLQLGVVNDAAARRLVAAGVDVVQDRCTLAEHRASGIGPRG